MEVGERHAIVLTDSGAFIRVPRRGRTLAVGEEIELPAPRARSLQRRTVIWSSTAAAAVALVFFLYALLPSFTPPVSARPVAYISIDINPGVELGLDAHSRVVEARGYTEHSSEWLDGLGLVGLPLESAVGAVMEAAQQSLLKERAEADIVITSVLVDDTAPIKESELQEKARTEVDRVIREYHAEEAESYRVTVWSAPKEVLEEAKEAGLSAGKMTFLLKAKASGVDVTAEELKKGTIRDIAKKYEDKQLLAPDPEFTKETMAEILEQVRKQRGASGDGGKKDANDKDKDGKGKDGKDDNRKENNGRGSLVRNDSGGKRGDEKAGRKGNDGRESGNRLSVFIGGNHNGKSAGLGNVTGIEGWKNEKDDDRRENGKNNGKAGGKDRGKNDKDAGRRGHESIAKNKDDWRGNDEGKDNDSSKNVSRENESRGGGVRWNGADHDGGNGKTADKDRGKNGQNDDRGNDSGADQAAGKDRGKNAKAEDDRRGNDSRGNGDQRSNGKDVVHRSNGKDVIQRGNDKDDGKSGRKSESKENWKDKAKHQTKNDRDSGERSGNGSRGENAGKIKGFNFREGLSRT